MYKDLLGKTMLCAGIPDSKTNTCNVSPYCPAPQPHSVHIACLGHATGPTSLALSLSARQQLHFMHGMNETQASSLVELRNAEMVVTVSLLLPAQTLQKLQNSVIDTVLFLHF